jgi:cytochrome c oxidase subunit 2
MGPAASQVAGLWWALFAAAVVVLAFVVIMLGLSAVRGRRRSEADARQPAPWGEPFIVGAGVVASGVLLVAFFLFSLWRMDTLAGAGRAARLTIDVIGHDWWWEVRYPNGAVTANEVHIPAGQPVRFSLTTKDVIHSFWVPELGPKADLIPGRTNQLWLEAFRPGTYRGQCAEFCGLQHANMIIRVFAEPAAAFAAWMAHQAEPARSGAEPGRSMFLDQSCAGCHSVRGTTAVGNVGPDLTHFAQRATIGSGVLANTGENLARWISDPQHDKPGVTMPPAPQLDPASLLAVVAYLQSLD